MYRTLSKNIKLVRAIFKAKELGVDDITITIESRALTVKKDISALQFNRALNLLDLLISKQKEPRTPLPLSSPGGN
jgi:16S rRNA U1498 N3-methylase RsmE|tara:strand:+ start:147 stop:374 length:228 start_codon:yes stop_codon:yes gene_type:complete